MTRRILRTKSKKLSRKHFIVIDMAKAGAHSMSVCYNNDGRNWRCRCNLTTQRSQCFRCIIVIQYACSIQSFYFI